MFLKTSNSKTYTGFAYHSSGACAPRWVCRGFVSALLCTQPYLPSTAAAATVGHISPQQLQAHTHRAACSGSSATRPTRIACVSAGGGPRPLALPIALAHLSLPPCPPPLATALCLLLSAPLRHSLVTDDGGDDGGDGDRDHDHDDDGHQ